ncbi:hypothetical protein TSAR_008820 [Trichomalopsis sarcophagae]|uniref:Membrane insertase YidC/Oxa/ALB C-terminal domain-containing protein n=1 Tax=Trichomalopsis sarcophagae TaxID=543379 RepID=A0A232FIA0_9HYME|nr:hypothetical protein TSAR_008820 [Trichomalopsis sarcophagae]
MISGVTNRVVTKSLRHHCRQILSPQYDINKSSSAYHTVNFHKKNENRNCHFPLSQHLSQKNVLFGSSPIHLSFQRNFASEIKDFEKMFNTAVTASKELIPAEEAAKIAGSALPEFAKSIADWKIVHLAQNTLLNMHDFTGLPWWASITLSALMARAVITLPFSLIQMHNTGKLQSIQPELEQSIKLLKNEANINVSYHGWPEKLARQHYTLAVKKEWSDLVQRENCHPAKSYILVLIQLPLWFSFSIATRNLSYMLPHPDVSAQITYMEMMVGGFGWVKNLTDVDHFLILPVTLGLLNLAVLETHNMFRIGEPTKFDRWRIILFRFISVALVPIAAYMPAATNIYWITSSSYGLMQAFLLNSTRLRRFLGVPILTPEMEHPYRHFYKNLKSRLRLA